MRTSTQFAIRIVYAASYSILEGIAFDIMDTTNDLLAVYDYRGVTVGQSLPPLLASTRGPWNDFETRNPMDLWKFGGLMRFMGASVKTSTLMWLELQPLRAFPPPIVIAPFNTGRTFGAGAGAGAGILTLQFPPVNASRARWPHNVELIRSGRHSSPIVRV